MSRGSLTSTKREIGITNLYSIPTEIWGEILSQLVGSAKTVASASIVSKQFNCIIMRDKDLKIELQAYKTARNLFVPPIEKNIIQIAVTGLDGCGKSSLSKEVLLIQVDGSQSYRKQIVVNGEQFILDIVDMVSPEEYDTYESTYYRTCHGVYGVYSITSESHLNQVEYYLEAAQSSKRIKQNIPIILVGNKSDLAAKRQVPDYRAEEARKRFNAMWIETSAKTGENIDESFMMLVRTIIEADNGRRTGIEEPLAPQKTEKRCIVS